MDEVVFAHDVPFIDPMVAAIRESDMPDDLAYYLATHKDELKRIWERTTRLQLEDSLIEVAVYEGNGGTKAPVIEVLQHL